MGAKASERWNEPRIFAALAGPFPDGAYVRIPQVRNGTGFRNRVRTADALIVSCWPSRGLWFAGVEIKVSPADWKRELANPAKSAEIQKWCDYWYVAAPKGVVPLGEVPPTWGLIEVDGRGAKVAKAAPKLKAKAADTAFCCAVLRAAMSGMVPAAGFDERVREEAEKLAARWSDSSKCSLEHLQKRVETFQEKTGISIQATWDYDAVRKAFDLVHGVNRKSYNELVEDLERSATRAIRLGSECLALIHQDEKNSGTTQSNVDDSDDCG